MLFNYPAVLSFKYNSYIKRVSLCKTVKGPLECDSNNLSHRLLRGANQSYKPSLKKKYTLRIMNMISGDSSTSDTCPWVSD